MTEADSSPDWVLDVFDDVEIPGWLFIPSGMTPQETHSWIEAGAATLSDVVGVERWDGEITTVDDVREVLGQAVEAREDSDSLAMFQIWPVVEAAAVMCHVAIVDSATLPDRDGIDGLVHEAEGTHLGPGLQYSTRVVLDGPDGPVDIVSVAFVFDDGEVALVLSLEGALTPLISHAVPGLVMLKDAIGMHRADTGAAFVAREPANLVEDELWQLEESR